MWTDAGPTVLGGLSFIRATQFLVEISMKSCGRLAGLGAILLLSVAPLGAGEWPGWRGPEQNGISTETGLVSSWSPEGENLIWKAEFIGRSTPVVFDGPRPRLGLE